MRPSISLSAEQLEKVIAALDTAGGCLMLVAEDRKPVDLEDCRAEIQAAYDDLAALADEHEVGE